MLFIEIFKGFIIGICASAPIGPIAIFVIQKSLAYGHRAGFITGLGSVLADTIFATISIFALAIAQNFINQHEKLILLIGGVIVGILGTMMMMSNPFRHIQKDEKKKTFSVKDFFQSLLMGLTNPGAIVVMFTLFAFFNVATPHDLRVAPVLLSVSAGAAAYWLGFSWVFSHIRKGLKLNTLIWINRISGIIVLIIGIALAADGLFQMLFQ